MNDSKNQPRLSELALSDWLLWAFNSKKLSSFSTCTLTQYISICSVVTKWTLSPNWNATIMTITDHKYWIRTNMNQHIHCTAWSKHCRTVVLYDSITFQNSDDQANMATFLWAALMAHHIRSWRERQHLGAFFMVEAQHGKMNDSVAKVFVRQTLSCSCFCDVYHINTRAHTPLGIILLQNKSAARFCHNKQSWF